MQTVRRGRLSVSASGHTQPVSSLSLSFPPLSLLVSPHGLGLSLDGP